MMKEIKTIRFFNDAKIFCLWLNLLISFHIFYQDLPNYCLKSTKYDIYQYIGFGINKLINILTNIFEEIKLIRKSLKLFHKMNILLRDAFRIIWLGRGDISREHYKSLFKLYCII